MPTTSDGGGNTSALTTYTTSGKTRQSASSTSNKQYDFLDFLGVAQSLSVDFLPITWAPALDIVGEGGTAEMHQVSLTLQMTFIFKRLKRPWGIEEEIRNLRALIAELSILGHPTIRHHPSVAKLEGICWDVISDEKVWPVLVFEKTRCGDLNRFMTSSPGRQLDLKRRLDILFDIGVAVRDLHAAGVIHGDIKPENILIFLIEEDHYVARVTDFGYSTLFATDNDLISMPNSGLWTAPERHHRPIRPNEARKMDAYSFGMLCLWLLCYNNESDTNPNFKKDVEGSHEVLDYASRLIGTLTNSKDQDKDKIPKIRKLLRLTLARDPAERALDFSELLQLLSSHRSLTLSSPINYIPVPHKNFEITSSLYQLFEAHYGVRSYIAKCLEKRQFRPSSSQCHTLDLAVCYELGLGIPRDIVRCHSMLSAHNIPIRDLEHKIEQIKEITHIPKFQDGIFRRFLEQGHFNAFDLSHQYREEQQLREVESRFQKEMKTLGSILGDDHILVQELRRQLSLLMVEDGRLDDAGKLQLQMMEIDKRVREYRWEDATYLASTYANQGRWKEAEELEVQVLEKSRMKLGAEHPSTITYMGNLAVTYWNQGRWEEAEELQLQVAKIRERDLGAEHPNTLISKATLASTYWKLGRWTEAEELNTQAMETSRKVLGVEHPHTISMTANLASTFRVQGRWEEAEELNRQIMEASKKVFGAEHPVTLSITGNQATIYREQGRLEMAEELQVQTTETSKKIRGMEHPETLSSMANLASIYRNQGRWSEAEELDIQVLETTQELQGVEHPNALASKANLASTFMGQERWKEAEQLLLQVIELRKESLREKHPSTLLNMASLAFIYGNENGRWKEGEELAVQVLKTMRQELGAEHPCTLRSIAYLETMYPNQGR